MRLKEIKSKVHAYLSRWPELRESDSKLIAHVWREETPYMSMSAEGFLRALASGTLTSPESIRRSAQWLREHHPELRGTNYKARKAKSAEVKQEILSL